MKKSAKKSSQNKSVRAKKPVARFVKSLKKTLAKAMAPKAAKKPQSKKPAPAKVAAPKTTAAKPGKVDKKNLKTAPVPTPAAAPANVKKGAKGAKGAAPAAAATAAAPAVAKGAKGKASKEAKPDRAPPKEKSAAAIKAAHDAGEKLCREAGCENFATTKGYCRLDYIKNWKKIKRKEMILKEGKLNQYIEELVSKYPDKYIDIIRQDLSTEVNFTKIIHDLELDESIDDLDYDGDSIDSLIGSISKSSDDVDDSDF